MTEFVGADGMDTVAMNRRIAAGAADVVTYPVGEGGRDIVPRFQIDSDAAYRPYVAIELHGGAGEDPALLGEGAAHFRGQPLAAAGLSPTPRVTVYAGLGPGAALVVPNTASTAVEPAAEAVAVTGAALLGARWETQSSPMVVEARADGVNHHGLAGTVTFAIELAP